MLKDETGNKVSFSWWLSWKIAKWHWRKWLEYEGMPEGVNDTDEMMKWQIKISKLNAYDAVINGQKAFIRPGSEKPRGWQITFRGRKPSSPIDCLSKGIGFYWYLEMVYY